MKKLYFFAMASAISLMSLTTKAQKSDYAFVAFPQKTAPEVGAYSNYKTYELYAYLADNTKHKLNDRYQPFIYGLTPDSRNGDLKIVVRINAVTITAKGLSKDTAILQATFNATNIAYDKEGQEIFNNGAYICDGKARQTGVTSNEQFEAIKDDLLKQAFANVLPCILDDFQKKYVGIVNRKKSLVFAKLFSLRDNATVTEINDSVSVINASSGNPETFKTKLTQQLPFWNKYATIKGVDKEELLRGVAVHNLALSHLVLGDTAAARTYFEQEVAADVLSAYLIKQQKKNFEQCKEAAAAMPATATFAHPATMVSALAMEQVIENIYYYTVEGTVTFTNGATTNGKCRIFRKSLNGNEGQIISLDKQDFYAEIEMQGDKKKVKLSEIKTIATKDNQLYAVQKESGTYCVFKTAYHSDKINVFNKTFPEGAPKIFYYQKAGEPELKSAPSIGGGKWVKKYFSDCPQLVEKIDKKELEAAPAIAQYYAENCK